jgi:hypothetical protein
MIYKIEPTQKTHRAHIERARFMNKPPKADKKKFVQFYFAKRN